MKLANLIHKPVMSGINVYRNDNLRRMVLSLTSKHESLLDVGSGSGSYAADFALNTGKHVSLIEPSLYCYQSSLINLHTNKISDFNIYLCTAFAFALSKIKRRYDCVVIDSTNVTALEAYFLFKNALAVNSRIVGVINADYAKLPNMKAFEVISKFGSLDFFEPDIDPNDGYTRLIYSFTVGS